MRRLAHCSEEQLLAHLDGELDASEEALVREHLETCWRCRAAQGSLEQQIRMVAERFERLGVPSPDRIAEAKVRMAQRCAAASSPRRHALPPFLFRLLRAPGAAAIAASVVVGVTGFGAWYYVHVLSHRAPQARVPVPIVERLPSPPAALSLPWIAAPGFRSPSPAATPPLLGSFRKPADAAMLEVEVCYALHRIRACLNEPLSVIRLPNGQVVVKGIVSSIERKSQILVALGEVRAPGWLLVEVRSAQELAQEAEPPGIEPPVQEAAEGPRYFVEEIERYFRGRGSPHAADSATRFFERAVSLSDGMLSEAWALRRLAERFPDTHAFEPRLAWLVEVMVRDHLRALREQAQAAGAEIRPVLSAIAEPMEPQPPPAAVAVRWQEVVEELLTLAERVRIHTTGLFAGAGLPAERDGDRVRIKSPHETLQALQTALRLLETDVDLAADRVAAEFSAKPRTAPRNN